MLKEYGLSFIIAFLFFFFIFFVNQILLVARNILLKNVSAVDMLKILLYSIPIILSYSFPFASMTGATMSLGDLSSRNEIKAMRTSGISYIKIITPVIALSLLLTGMSFLLNDFFLPLGTIKYKQLYRELLYENPGLDLESYSVSRFNDLIFINGKFEDGKIEDLLVLDTNNSKVDIISSEQASLVSNDDTDDISLHLDTVRTLFIAGDSASDYDLVTADAMEYFIALNDISFNLLSVAPNEKSIRDLSSDIAAKRQELDQKNDSLVNSIEELRYQTVSNYYAQYLDDASVSAGQSFKRLKEKQETSLFSRTLQYYLLEFYKKSALPFACFFLVFFALPFSLIEVKNGRLVGFSIGIIASVTYWFMLFAGQTIGVRSAVNPFLIMWTPNLLLFSIGIVFLALRVKR